MVATTVLCMLVTGLLVVAATAWGAGAEAPEPPEYIGIPFFPNIEGPSGPEEFSWRVQTGEEQELRQVSETEAEVVYKSGPVAFPIKAVLAHAADGANVPTTLRVSEGDVVTLTVHHRAGNPAAAGAPFVYPIFEGSGWEGGYHTVSVQGPSDEAEEKAAAEAAASRVQSPAPPAPAPIPVCAVPSLRGLSLHAAKSRLRADDCAVGAVRLAHGATARAGKVVRQSSPAGTRLAAGAPVAVRLGAR